MIGGESRTLTDGEEIEQALLDVDVVLKVGVGVAEVGPVGGHIVCVQPDK